jgi:hypothetical protein
MHLHEHRNIHIRPNTLEFAPPPEDNRGGLIDTRYQPVLYDVRFETNYLQDQTRVIFTR